MTSTCATLADLQENSDQAQLLLQEYAKLSAVEFTEELQYLHQWVLSQEKNCLLITGEAGSGKKTLLHQFLKASQETHPNWVCISQFGSVTPVYSTILFRTMVSLRSHFKIEQKVDLNEQKLRRYFKYWLEVTSDFLNKEYLGYHKKEVPKVVIIIEGIDACVDSKGNPVQPQFWLPLVIPPNIKLILTSQQDSPQLLQSCLTLRHQMSKEKRDKVTKGFSAKVESLAHQNRQLSLSCLRVADKMISVRPNMNFKGESLEEIFKQYISDVASSQLSEEVIRSLLYTLTLTTKGIRSKELARIVHINLSQWEKFHSCFSFLIVESQGHHIICHKSIKEALQNLIDPSVSKAKVYRHSIALHLRKENMKLRGLQEVINQLLLSQSYSELKEVVSRVQNFLMLYTPLSKELLCQCWVRLEQSQQYDPVYEYNKAIQAYASHYYPREEQFYKIIFQICLFFKEYAQFQNSKTPTFRHPLVKGQNDNLSSIGIYQEFQNLSMIGKCKISKLKPIQKADITWQGPPNNEIDPKKSRMVQRSQSEVVALTSRSKLSEKISQKQIPDETDESQKQIEINRYSSLEEGKVLNVEELNVSILANQEKFRQHFLGEMKQYLQNYFVPLKKLSYVERELHFQGEDSQNDDETVKQKVDKEFKVDVDKLVRSFLLKQFRQHQDETYHKAGEERQYYYYKQWVWLQFPWLCQTIKHVYSDMLKECLPGSIHYMSPMRELALIRDVLKMVRTAKENKLGVFTDKKLEIIPIRIKAKAQEYLKNDSSRREVRSTNKTALSKLGRPVEDSNISSHRVDPNKLDDEIQKLRQEEDRLRQNGCEKRMVKGSSSLPQLNLFVTQFGQQSHHLPSMKKSKFVVEKVKKRNNKQNNQDSRDFALVIRKYNEYKHENDMLLQKIEEAKKLENKTQHKSQQELIHTGNAIEDFESKRAQLERSYAGQMDLKKKLQVIIRICDLNKMYGSETDHLSCYLQNLKKMIGFEEARISQHRANIQHTIDHGKVVIKDLKNKRKEIKLMKEQDSLAFCALNSDSTNMRLTELGVKQIELELKEMGRSIKQKSKKTKSVRERVFLSSKDYDILQQSIGIHYEDQENQTKIQTFADRTEKLKELKSNNVDMQREHKIKKKELQAIRFQQKAQLKGEAREKQIRVATQLVDRRKELAQIKSRNMLLLHSLNVLTV